MCRSPMAASAPAAHHPTVKDASGKVVYDVGRTNWGRVVRSDDVAQMNDMLTATIQFGTGNQGSIEPHPAAGKTGTGQDYRDAWFIGYTAHYVTGVWLGNDDFKPMKRVTGGSLPTMIWRDLMIYAHVNKEPAHLPGGEQVEARTAGRAGCRRARRNASWNSLFGGGGSSAASRDSTLARRRPAIRAADPAAAAQILAGRAVYELTGMPRQLLAAFGSQGWELTIAAYAGARHRREFRLLGVAAARQSMLVAPACRADPVRLSVDPGRDRSAGPCYVLWRHLHAARSWLWPSKASARTADLTGALICLTGAAVIVAAPR